LLQENSRGAKPLTYEWYAGSAIIKGTCIPAGAGRSLSLRDLYHQDDVARDPDLASFVAEALGEHDIQVGYAPSVAAMNAEVVARDDLSTRIELAPGRILYRNKDVPADGVRISQGEAFVMSNAGCPPVVTHGRGRTFVGHMGRKSGIDEDRIRSGTPRRFESVLHALAAEYEALNIPLHEVQVLMLFSIKSEDFTHPFDHPDHGRFNRDMYHDVWARWGDGIMTEGDGRLSMPALARAQAKEIGFGSFTSKCPLPARSAFASTRDPREARALNRNLTIVWRS
jgi:hypothetical protein